MIISAKPLQYKMNLKRYSIILVFFAAYLGSYCCQGSSILFLLPFGTKSHKGAITPIIEEVATRGHNVTVISPYKMQKPAQNIKEIFLPGIAELINDDQLDWFAMQKQSTVSQIAQFVYDLRGWFTTIYEALFTHPEVKEMIEDRQKHPVDLIIVDCLFNELSFPVIETLKVPFIFHCSNGHAAYLFVQMGGSMDLATVPVGLTESINQMNFFERLNNAMSYQSFTFIYRHFVLDRLEETMKKEFPNMRTIDAICRDASLVIMNDHFTTGWPRSLPPAFVRLGMVHARPAKPLQEPFKSFVDEAKDGFIVFTLGSVIPVKKMPQNILQAFTKVFARIKQRVIWKWEADDIPQGLPQNVKMSKWLPQQDLLGHPNARLFITHGGLLGIQEAVYHGIPVLGLPFGNDQRSNMAKAAYEGYALELAWDSVNEEILYDYVNRLVTDPNFKANATRMSNLVRDELVPSKDLAMYWIEHVIRHGGTKHLQLPSKHMPFYQRYMLDVAAFLVAILIVGLMVDYLIIKWIVSHCISRLRKAPKSKTS